MGPSARRRAGLAVVLAVAIVAACGSEEEPWAQEADGWIAAFVELSNTRGGAAQSLFWGPALTWDARSVITGSEVLDRPGALDEVIATMPRGAATWSEDSPPLVSVDGIVLAYTFDWGPSGLDRLPDTATPAHLVTLMRPMVHRGADRVTLAMATGSRRERRVGDDAADTADGLATAWAGAWTSLDPARFAALYSADPRVADSIGGGRAAGLQQVLEMATSQGARWQVAALGDGSPAVYPIAWAPRGFVGFVALMDGVSDAGCPGRIAVAAEVHAEQIFTEVWFRQLDQARSCVSADRLPSVGWWTDRETPTL